ncbi:Ribokinase-like protein [Hesseltinella vesiculosa]|uniref:Adenosine kinase n=1 Tax=Hesseltinella vesiculosa TaxID=101127 RepID=A0A1X2G6E6_9FUNG|nr:Ribokinase-like protein [Hesseltinella vesiculosa]
MPYALLALENPLLDIQANVSDDLLAKYNLKANDAILAGAEHQPLYTELVEEYKVVYVAGGAAQNTARGAQYIMPPNSTVYMGAVSNDAYADTIKKAAEADGIKTNYQIITSAPTGTCAALITGHHRSLVTNLGAADLFTYEFVQQPENWKLVEEAQYYYVGGFFLTHDGGYNSSVAISEHAAKNNKTFALNLSAPFLSEFFKERLDAIIKNTDILMGNETEARTYAKQAGWDTEDVTIIATKLSELPKGNARPRTVVITQGADETVVAVGKEVQSFPTPKVADQDIVDTNGCGDAFCGGFMGLYAQGVTDLARCVKAGQYVAGIVIKQVGPTFPHGEAKGTIPTF